MNITNDTPLAMLTVGQFLEIASVGENKAIKVVDEKQPKRYVYGLSGIRKLFNVSHVTAQKYKDTILRDAVSQQGRVIVTDVDKAMELFSKNQK